MTATALPAGDVRTLASFGSSFAIHDFSAAVTAAVGCSRSARTRLVARAILVDLQQIELHLDRLCIVRRGGCGPRDFGHSSSLRPFAVMRHTRPRDLSRRGSRSEYCMWPTSGLNQSIT